MATEGKKPAPARKRGTRSAAPAPADAPAPALAPSVLPADTVGVSTPGRADALLVPVDSTSLLVEIDLTTLTPAQRILLDAFLDEAECKLTVIAKGKGPRI